MVPGPPLWMSVPSSLAAHRYGNDSLTFTSFLAGARYRVPQPWFEGSHKPQPFVQILLGAAHAGGGVAGVADGS